MKYIYYILSILFTLSLGSCKDDIPGSDNPNIGGITLTLTSGNMETRTNLTSTAATQNVDSVYIALYKVNEDGVYDNATFVAAKDFEWEESSLTSYEKQTKTLTFDKLVAGEEYILLAVGLDAESKETYGFNDINSFESKLTGKTLAEAKAIAANAASIATSELFAGWNTFTYEPDIENKVEVEMKRRVAGVLCYLTDIPYKLTTNNTTYRITEIRLNLMDKQNNEISLRRINPTNDNLLPDDFGTYNDLAPEISNTICSFYLMGYQPDSKKELYVISPSPNQLENTLLKGAYVLPIKNEDVKNTLELELWGKAYDENKDDHIADGAALTKITTFPVEWDNVDITGENKKSYSIRPNYIYHIGEKPESGSTEGDYPMSLAGTKITVTAKVWDEEEVNVEFPSVPVNATMELTYGGASVNNDYIFDCIGTYNSIDMNEDEPLRLKVNPSVLGTSWKLFIAANSGVYVKNPDDNKFVDGFTYKSKNDENTKGKTFDLLLTDYINISSDKPLDEDYREIKINLTTYDKDGKPLSFVQELVIKQYNAVIIAVTDKKEEELRAFSRYDYNSSELMSTEGTAEEWGYYENVWPQLSNVYHNNLSENSDGFENFYSIKENAEKTLFTEIKKDYNNSLVKKIIKDRVMISNGIKSTITTFSEIIDEDVPDIWYLPARNELTNFLFKFSLLSDSQQKQSLFVQTYDANKAGYWTSNATGSWISLDYHSYYNYVKNDGTLLIGVDGSDSKAHTHRSSKYYARRACRIE